MSMQMPPQAARILEHALARANVRWLDGLVLLPEWLEGGQEKSYAELMQALVAKANSALADVGIGEPHLKRYGEQDWKWYAENTAELPKSNISASRDLTTSAKVLFQKSRVNDAVGRLTKAYQWWFDASGIAEAVCAAPDTADALRELAKLPASLMDDLQAHATQLLFAIGAVRGATRTDPEQFQPDVVNPVLSEWIDTLVRATEALRRLRRRVVAAPAPIEDDLQEFARLAKRYVQSLPEISEREHRKQVWRAPSGSRRRRASRVHADGVEPSAEAEAEARERDQLLAELVDCALVSQIREELRTEREISFGGRTDTRDDRGAVRYALHELLSSREPIEPSHLVARLRRKIRLAIGGERGREVLEVREPRPWAARKEVEKTLEALLAGALDLDAGIRATDSVIRKDLGSNLRTLIRRALRQRQLDLPLPRGLRPLKDEMKTRSEEQPQWFRKTGPTAADFQHERVWRLDDLIDEVRKRLIDSRVVLVSGERATGKSVLARWLANDWSNGEFDDCYYLDCQVAPDFDVEELARFIRRSDELFILENMHLASDKLQRLWGELRHADLDGFVLITARPISHTDTRLESLDTLPTVLLPPFAYADDIISAFAARAEHPDVFASQATRDQLCAVAKDDYWLLTYALRGCDAATGHGEPKAWIGEGVREDLRNLELDSAHLPRILLSLAPLYIHETLTAEAFLINHLGFSETELQELLRRREIVRSEQFGQFFYGLPHASLAEAYWEHGQEFRRQPWGLDEFIHAYSAAGLPNSLRATRCARRSDVIISRLLCESRLGPAVRNAGSLFELGLIFPTILSTTRCDPARAHGLAEDIGVRLGRPDAIHYCWHVLVTWWNHESICPVRARFAANAVPAEVAKAINVSYNVHAAITVLAILAEARPGFQDKVWASVDKTLLVSRVFQLPADMFSESIEMLVKTLPTAWAEIRTRLTRELVTENIQKRTLFHRQLVVLRSLYEADPAIRTEGWGLTEVAECITASASSVEIEIELSTWLEIDAELVEKVVKHVDFSRVRERALRESSEVNWDRALAVLNRAAAMRSDEAGR